MSDETEDAANQGGPGWGAPGGAPGAGGMPPGPPPPGGSMPPPGGPGMPGQPPYGQAPGYPGAPAYGYPVPYGYPVAGKPTNNQATVAMVLGIVSVTTCWIFTGIPAIIVGSKARREIRESGGAQDGDGLALAGLIMGWIGTALSVLVIGFYAVMLILVVAVGESTDDWEPSSTYYCDDYDEYTYNDC